VAAAMPGQSCVGRTHRNSNNNLQSPLSFTAATGLSVCLSVRPSVCPSVTSVHYLSPSRPVCLSHQSAVFLCCHQSVYLSVCLSVTSVRCLSLLPPVCLSVRLSVCHISPLSFSAATGLSICPSVCLSHQSAVFHCCHRSVSLSRYLHVFFVLVPAELHVHWLSSVLVLICSFSSSINKSFDIFNLFHPFSVHPSILSSITLARWLPVWLPQSKFSNILGFVYDIFMILLMLFNAAALVPRTRLTAQVTVL